MPRLFSVAAKPSAHGSVQSRKCRVHYGGTGASNFTLSDRYVSSFQMQVLCDGKPQTHWVMFSTAKHLLWAAVLYGLSVHMKIYPITYALPIALTLRTSTGHTEKSKWKSFIGFIGSFLNRELLLFASVSSGVFFMLAALFYYMWVDTGKSLKLWLNYLNI